MNLGVELVRAVRDAPMTVANDSDERRRGGIRRTSETGFACSGLGVWER
jgi:hypothetical protein